MGESAESGRIPFSAVASGWFRSAFAQPTPAQEGAWKAISSGRSTLVVAPTGSGKTLAAFMWALDRLVAAEETPAKDRRLRVLYVSPLKALAVDIDRNLRSPLSGMRAAAARLGAPPPDIRVAIRTGDTPAADRRRFVREPPDILITTPESLFLILTSAARESLQGIQTVIVDEIHAVAGTKRGAHLALSLERLDERLPSPAQRIGLSATVRPLEDVARFLGGPRPVTVVAPPFEKSLDLSVVVPVQDMEAPEETGTAGADPERARDPDRAGIWPAVIERLVDLVEAHRSTIVFANSRRLAERLCARMNEEAWHRAGEDRDSLPEPGEPAAKMAQAGAARGAPAEIARAHHGSVSREQRLAIEEDLKAGRLPCVVATSSLELGIDMGRVDLVVQVEAPPSVASGMQRIGRAGHGVGEVSRGVVLPKFRGDLVECAVVVERMRAGLIEELRVPRNPLDVLAQQVVAMAAMDDWPVDRLEETVRRAAPFATLPRRALEGVLDMLAGRYPSDEFAGLRPRITWDRTAGVIGGRPGAQRVAVTSGGTIPDRGLFGVFLAAGEGGRPSRVGELDEEMVYESRVGDVFVLGSSSWQIQEITRDRVIVVPVPGRPGKMPFWVGDAPGRPVELGRALGAFRRELARLPPDGRDVRLKEAGLDRNARANLVGYLDEQREATGVLPDDRTIVVERFRDELGDWRVCVHSPFGAPVHAPWSQAIEARVRERLGLEAQTMYSDDGIVVRLPEADEAPPATSIMFEPEEVEDLVVGQVGSSALFASRFREAASRSLLLPRRRPGLRTPLWQQRQRSAELLQVASRFGEFPIVLETYRECLQDVFDLPALVELMASIRRREVRVVEVDTAGPSPFARSLLFGYVAAFMYEGDAPLAERRAQALTLDRAVLAELLGRDELRDLIDPGVLADLELSLQGLSSERRCRGPDDLHDALRSIGDLSGEEVTARCPGSVEARNWLEALEGSRRAIGVRVGGQERWAAIEDASRLRDALGAALPVGVPAVFLEPVADPVGDLVGRFARTHGPFVAGDVTARLGLGVAVVEETLRRLEADGRVASGEFRPGASGREWIDAGVLRRLRNSSLAASRRDVEPVPAGTLGLFLPAWHGIGPSGGHAADVAELYRVIEQIQGAPVPASALESLILPARLPGYRPAMLDELCASGDVVWAGAGGIGQDDGWASVYVADTAPLLMPPPAGDEELSELARAVHAVLVDRGAMFFRQVVDGLQAGGPPATEAEVLLAVWELVWAGLATNDTPAPLRALTGGLGRRRVPSRASRSGDVRWGGRGRPARLARQGPPAAAGRWSLLPERTADPTRRAHAQVELLLGRHGVLTRGAVAAERFPGGFAGAYPILKAMEEAGRCRRGYFVEGLGGAQFASPGAVERLRAEADARAGQGEALAIVLAATDPANPFGAALPWPERASGLDPRAGHRPGRKAGALVVLVRGRLTLYVERGGRTLLTFDDDPAVIGAAAAALAGAARRGALGRLTVERADGRGVFDTPLAAALSEAGFVPSTRGLRLRRAATG